MEIINNKCYDEERALYGSENLCLIGCQFDGVADGEGALKESNNILIESCYFNLRYPFWHNEELTIAESEMTINCRAPIWYSKNIQIDKCKIDGVKAIRECENVRIFDSTINSPELGWSTSNIKLRRTLIDGEYMFLRAKGLDIQEVTASGKYSFQYIENAVIENCTLNTKDAFWHAKDVVVRNCTVKGEALGWYSENLIFENCRIVGTQPFCYCKNLTLKNCEMLEASQAFEKSEVTATLVAPIISIKNPTSGIITVPFCEEIIKDDISSNCQIIIK